MEKRIIGNHASEQASRNAEQSGKGPQPPIIVVYDIPYARHANLKLWRNVPGQG
jgi:hypothetical protein